ncbi:hypothetical protein D9M72_501240 [compost metagenome]
MHRLAIHHQRVDAQAAVELREVAADDMNGVVARAGMHHVARADVQEGVVAAAAFESVGEAELGDEHVVMVGVFLGHVVEHPHILPRVRENIRRCKTEGAGNGHF